MIRSRNASAPHSMKSTPTGSSGWCSSARARGDARTDSDDDVAVFLKDFVDRWQEVDRMVPIVTDIVEETGAVIHPMPYPEGFHRERTSLMREVRSEGVDL